MEYPRAWKRVLLAHANKIVGAYLKFYLGRGGLVKKTFSSKALGTNK